MPPASTAPTLCYALALVFSATGLFGCATTEPPAIEARSGLACVDDSSECIARRQATMRLLVDDKTRGWMKEPPTPEAYASGVRLFAMKTKKKELSCDELAAGKREAEAARSSLHTATGRLTHTQIARGAMLGTEIARELGNEFNRRCKKG